MAAKKPPKDEQPEKEGRATRTPRTAKSTAAPLAKRAPRKAAVDGASDGAADGSRDRPSIPRADLERLLSGSHSDPHSILGAHAATVDGVIVRALIPNATGA